MDDYDRHYMALGLRRGASQDEIRSAFRRLAKLYHPDQDASLDAEMRYREVRRAYDALRKKPEVPITSEPLGPTDKPPSWTFEGTREPWQEYYQTAGGSGWYVRDADDEEDDEDLLWGYDTGERIPFSFGKAHIIFWESVKETASVEKFLRLLLYVVLTNDILDGLGYGKQFSYMFIFCSLTGFVFFRYYLSGSSPTAASKLKANCLWSLCYIAATTVFLLTFGSSRGFLSVKSWFAVPFEMFISLLLLWAPPIVWKKRQRDRGFYI